MAMCFADLEGRDLTCVLSAVAAIDGLCCPPIALVGYNCVSVLLHECPVCVYSFSATRVSCGRASC